jgi:hypothetical protein
MPKIEIEVPKCEYDIIADIAKKLGVPAQTLFQQQIDRDIEDISCWVQRAELLNR